MEELSEEDRFMLRFSRIPRLPERMATLTFLGNFPDTVQLLMPVWAGQAELCGRGRVVWAGQAERCGRGWQGMCSGWMVCSGWMRGSWQPPLPEGYLGVLELPMALPPTLSQLISPLPLHP